MPNCEAVAAEFTLAKLGFGHEDKEVFLTSSWSCISQAMYFTYRLIVLIAIISFTIWQILYVTHVLSFSLGFWLLFPSNHALVLFCCLNICWCVLIASGVCFKRKVGNGTKILWFLYVISTDLILGIVGFYWVILYSHTAYPDDNSNIIKYNVYFHLMHLLPLVIVSMDTIFTNIPVRMAHLIYPIGATILYMVFSIVYYKINPKSIQVMNTMPYPHIDWSDLPEALMACMLVVIMVTACHCFLYIIHSFKLAMVETSAKIDSDLELDNKTRHPSPAESPKEKKTDFFS